MTIHSRTIAVFGGNGFVGVHVLEKLASKGIRCICISRTGAIPVHLRGDNSSWMNRIEWVKGDAGKPDAHLLKDAEAVITLVGSPPIPTLSKKARERQIYMNGDTNAGAIEGAALAGVKRVVLLNAHMPKLLQTPRFGYYMGKMRALKAAKKFAALSPEHSAVVVRPTAIYGLRHTRQGKPIPLNMLMAPIANIQLAVPRIVQKALPEPLVSVEQVATVIADAAMGKQWNASNFTIIENDEVLQH